MRDLSVVESPPLLWLLLKMQRCLSREGSPNPPLMGDCERKEWKESSNENRLWSTNRKPFYLNNYVGGMYIREIQEKKFNICTFHGFISWSNVAFSMVRNLQHSFLKTWSLERQPSTCFLTLSLPKFFPSHGLIWTKKELLL